MPSSREELEESIERIERNILSADPGDEEHLIDELRHLYLGLAGDPARPDLEVGVRLDEAHSAADDDVGERSIRCKLCGAIVESIIDHMRNDHHFLHPELYRVMFSLPRSYPLVAFGQLAEMYDEEERKSIDYYYQQKKIDAELYFTGHKSNSYTGMVEEYIEQIRYYLSLGRAITDIADELYNLSAKKGNVRSIVDIINKRTPARKVKKRSILGYPAPEPARAPSPTPKKRKGSAFPREMD